MHKPELTNHFSCVRSCPLCCAIIFACCTSPSGTFSSVFFSFFFYFSRSFYCVVQCCVIKPSCLRARHSRCARLLFDSVAFSLFTLAELLVLHLFGFVSRRQIIVCTLVFSRHVNAIPMSRGRKSSCKTCDLLLVSDVHPAAC